MVDHTALEKLAEADHGVQGRAQFVTDRRDEIAFCPVRRLRQFHGFLKFLLLARNLRDVHI